MTTEALKPRRRRRWLRWTALVLIVLLLVAGELYSRFELGLGDPPLFVTDPQIEYLYKPSSSYHRFGNRLSFNSFSMRSDEFPQHKSDPNEFRVMVLGDSIINGGGLIDQPDTATEVLRARLQQTLNRPVIVGNISAGSWGPPNLLAYVKRYGFFDADAVIIVVGSEDYGDVPTFGPLSRDTPVRAPLCALQEALQRYVPQVIKFQVKGDVPPEPGAPSQKDIDESMDALRQLMDMATESGAKVALALHLERREITRYVPKPGALAFREAAAKRGIPVIELGPRLGDSIVADREPFRDFVHPNAHGHAIFAEAFYRWIMQNMPAKNP